MLWQRNRTRATISLTLMIALTGAGSSSVTSNADTPSRKLRIATYIAPPYQTELNGKLAGTSTDTVRCLFDRIDQPYELLLYPPKRAYGRLHSGSVDALYSYSDSNPKGDDVPVSSPIALEKWYFYSNLPLTDRKDKGPYLGDIGVVLGTDHERWLDAEGYDVKVRAPSLDNLLNMLALKRIDTILADQNTVQESAIYRKIISLGSLHHRFVQYQPKRIALNQHASRRYPSLISELNREINTCKPISMALEQFERELIREQMQDYLADVLESYSLLQAVHVHNQRFTELSQEQINALDDQWAMEQPTQQGELIQRTVFSPEADVLRLIKKRSEGVIEEILLVDAQGINVVTTDLSSDFYQGDEKKFRNAIAVPEDFYIEDIHYDESTGHYLSHVSQALIADDDMLAGVVIFGVNVEKALLSQFSD